MTKILAVFLLFFSYFSPAIGQQLPAETGKPFSLPASPDHLRQLLEQGRRQLDLEERYNRMRTDNAGPCVDHEKRLSYAGMEHCRLHPIYQQVFPLAGCHCSTGQCRPTEFRRVAVTAENPTGIEVEVNGKYYPAPESALRKMIRGKIPDALLEYEAHVCAIEYQGTITIECIWIGPQSRNETPQNEEPRRIAGAFTFRVHPSTSPQDRGRRN